MRSTSSCAAAARGVVDRLPKHARVLVVGGGVVGCSVAYHLSRLLPDGGGEGVHVLEQDKLTSGTTWHAAGLIGTSRATETETRLSIAGKELYEALEAETGQSTGYKSCGSLSVARCAARMTALERSAAKARAFGLEAEMVSARECGELWAHGGVELMRTNDLAGGLWLPGDGSASPTDVTMSLAAGARQKGATFHEGVRVSAFDVASIAGDGNGRRRVTGVTAGAAKGGGGATKAITADAVVLCGGQWTRDLAARAGANVPLHSAEHFYIITQPIPGAHPNLPVMRDPDAYTYFREWGGGLCVGGFEPTAKPIFSEGVPDDFAFGLLPDDWDHFAILFEGAAERVPALIEAQVQSMVNGPESFTTDAHYILGEAPEADGLFVCAGMNSSGIASAGGAGKALAEWVVEGSPTMDLWPVDIRRFGDHHRNVPMLRDRISETLGVHYKMPWPRRELASARNLRVSPLFAQLSEGQDVSLPQDGGGGGRSERLRPVWGEKFGWERANFFAPASFDDGLADPEDGHTFGRPRWHDLVAAEHRHCREEVALFDVTSFAKTLVQGRDAAAFLQRVCANDVGGPPGSVVYTGMLNARGGYEADVTVTRLDETSFSVVSPTGSATRDQSHLRRHVRADEFATVADVTGAQAVLSVMGPRSRELLQLASGERVGDDAEAGDLAGVDDPRSRWSNARFPFGTAQHAPVGRAMVHARRVTYVGELGWELYAPAESAHEVYAALHAASGDGGGGGAGAPRLRDAGYYAVDALRTEKAFRAWGHELTPDVTPDEAGLAFAVDFDKGVDFVGRAALLARRAAGPVARRVVSLVLDAGACAAAPDATQPWGGEPVHLDGAHVGTVESASFGHTVGSPVCLAMVSHPEIGTKGFVAGQDGWAVDIAGVRVPATARLSAPYDPKGLRMRA